MWSVAIVAADVAVRQSLDEVVQAAVALRGDRCRVLNGACRPATSGCELMGFAALYPSSEAATRSLRG